MGLVQTNRELIAVRVADRTIAETTVCQQAVFISLRHEQAGTGECSAYITLRIDLFAKLGDALGAQLQGNGFSSYPAALKADNDTIVAVPAGEILAIRNGESDVDWLAKAEAYEEPVMLQGDFFELLRETQDIRIGDLIRQHIQQADAMGKFA